MMRTQNNIENGRNFCQQINLQIIAKYESFVVIRSEKWEENSKLWEALNWWNSKGLTLRRLILITKKKLRKTLKIVKDEEKKTLFPWQDEWCGNGNVSKSELINLKCLENLSVKK